MSYDRGFFLKQKIYNKANSILELRGVNKKRKDILDTIFSQKDTHPLKSDSVIKLVIKELFSTTELGTNKSNFYLRDHVVEEMAKIDKSDYFRYLKYRYKYDVFPVTHELTNFPPLVQIEPTSICNYRCVFCYQTDPKLSNKKNGQMGVMDLDLFKNLIDQLDGNVEAVTLASRGEPTVNKKLPEFLQYMTGKFLASKINTNASLLDEKMIHAILKADLQTLVFSADAASDPLYSKLRVGGSLDKVLGNIENFHKIKESQYPKSKIITRVSGVKYNDEQNIDDMEEFWKKYVDQVAFVDYNPWENVYDSNKNDIKTPCSDLWRRMFIWWDGKIAPCDVDYLTTLINDSAIKNTIPEIWNGDMYKELRLKHINGNRGLLEPCSRCVFI